MLDPGRTIAVICGAQSFPRLPQFEAAAAFGNSATAIRRFLGERAGAALPAENVCWLFDQPGSHYHYDHIAGFVRERLAVAGAPDGAGWVVLFVYVGHGALLGAAAEYCLLLTDTRAPTEADTSLRVSSLLRVLSAVAPRSARVLVLDCCFAALAASYVQGGVGQVVSAQVRQVLEAVPGDPGVAILAAAGARKEARLADPSTYTLFTQGLMRVLTGGDLDQSGPLSLRRVSQLVYEALVAAQVADPPRPEVHVPDQTGGDLGAVPMFPNRAAALAADPKNPPVLTSPGAAAVDRSGFVARLTEVLALASWGKRFHVAPHIPPRHTAAVRRIRTVSADEETLAVLDLNAFWRGNQLAVFSDWGFRYRTRSLLSSVELDLPYPALPGAVMKLMRVRGPTTQVGTATYWNELIITTSDRSAQMKFPYCSDKEVDKIVQLLESIRKLVIEHRLQ